jgi:AcrR family transcriptional regulator/DNA-binding MarR family transcriptional regulator
MQRSRLLVAAVSAVVEHGWEGASVARITQRAGVSRRTFYEMFDNREECLHAVLENAVTQIKDKLTAADLAGLAWCERVRSGLWTVLCFFDREPRLACVCLVESRRGGGIALDYRQEIIEELAMIVEEGSSEGPGRASRSEDTVSLTAHGVVGGVCEVLYSRLLKAPTEPLHGLLGELMGMIVLPYMGPAVARREQAKPLPELEPINQSERTRVVGDAGERVVVLPMRLTYRTASVLQALAERPGQSNRQVADRVGISDQGQASKLLARLAHLGLLVNDEAAKGERNKWVLTPTGRRVTRSIQSYTPAANTASGQTS